MKKINSDYMEISQQRIYMHYNYIYTRYMKKNHKWYSEINNDKLKKIYDILNKISYIGDKHDIASYFNIYNFYLSQHNDIFNDKTTFIDLGSAPGGFLKYANSIKMNGIGISLSPEKKGLKFKETYNYDIIYGDLLLDIDKVTEKIKINNVDFINFGAISYEIVKSSELKQQQQLLINQFYIAQQYLKKNGSIMFIINMFDYIFYSMDMLEFIIEMFNTSDIHIIPVQPEFKTFQVYILVKNITITNDILQQLCILLRKTYNPIVEKTIYETKLEKIFASKKLNVNSFIDAYYVNLFRDIKIIPATDTIKIKRLKYISASEEEIYEINKEFIKYPEIISKHEYYCPVCKKNTTINISDIRNEFIKKNKLNIDKDNNIIFDDTLIDNINTYCDKIYNYSYQNILKKI